MMMRSPNVLAWAEGQKTGSAILYEPYMKQSTVKVSSEPRELVHYFTTWLKKRISTIVTHGGHVNDKEENIGLFNLQTNNYGT